MAAILACVRRFEAGDFRSVLQPLLERFLSDDSTRNAARGIGAIFEILRVAIRRPSALWLLSSVRSRERVSGKAYRVDRAHVGT